METMVSALAGQVNLPSSVAKRAVEYYRTLEAKQTMLGISSSFQAILCLHIAAAKETQNPDLKKMCQAAGAKSKSQYMSMLHSLESILDIGTTLSLQEISVQVGAAPSVISQASAVLKAYEAHLAKAYGGQRSQNINFNKPIYGCAAMLCSSKLCDAKLEVGKLVELARCKKKELLDLCEEMTAVAPKKDKSSRGQQSEQQRSLMERIMLGDTQEPLTPKTAAAASLKRPLLENEDQAFEDWKQGILKRAVEAGFKQYSKFLRPMSTTPSRA